MTTLSTLTRPATWLGGLASLTLLAAVPAIADTHFHAYSSATAYVADASLFNANDPLANIVSPWAPFATSDVNFISGQGQVLASASNAGYFDGRYVESMASSSLIDGTLKARANAAAFQSVNGYQGLAAGIAELGDRFTVGSSNAGAFSWTPNSQAHFAILLDGFSFSSAAATQQIFFLGLSISSVDGTKSGSGNVSGFLDAAGTQSTSSWANPANTLPLALSWQRDSNSGDYRISADFKPGGDFDWSLTFFTVAQVNNDSETVFTDYSHTAKLLYAGPDASTTYSASGSLPGTLAAAVPEPSSWAMTLAGLAAVGFLVRRRSAQTTARISA